MHKLLPRTVLTVLVLAPLGVMGALTATVLWPALSDPISKIYSSSIGYPAQQRKAGQPIQVQTVAATLKPVGNSIAAPGESVALQQVDIRALVEGPVEKVLVVEGQQVRKGQPLLQIQQAPYENAVNVARNNVAIAQATVESLERSMPKQLALLEANVANAKSKIAIAQAQLQGAEALAQQEQKARLENATGRVEIAKAKYQQISALAAEGAISQFQLYENQDALISRKNELIAAQQETVNLQTQLSENRNLAAIHQMDLRSAQNELDRTKAELTNRLENARLTLRNNKIILQNALRDLNHTTIYATTDSLVSRVNIHSGEVADTRTSLVTLNQNVVFKSYIDQSKIDTVKIGDRATLRLVAYPGRSYEGRIVQLNPTVETDSNKVGRVGVDRQYTYSVWVAVDALQMPPGLQGYAQFDGGQRKLVIPENAVTHLSGGEGLVMVSEQGKAVVKKVQLGRIFDNQREVLSGLQPNMPVILSPSALKPGDVVKSESASS